MRGICGSPSSKTATMVDGIASSVLVSVLRTDTGK